MAGELHALLVTTSEANRERAAAVGAPAVPLAAGGLALLPLTDEIVQFHGGVGFQAAVAWRAEAICWGPVFTATAAGEAEDHYEVLPGDRRADMAINRVLRRLGVHRDGEVDEFAAAGLTRHSWTDDWAAT